MESKTCTKCGCKTVFESRMPMSATDRMLVEAYEFLKLNDQLCWDCFWYPFWGADAAGVDLSSDIEDDFNRDRTAFAWSYYL